MDKELSMDDVQRYYLSFFGGLRFPKANNTEDIIKEIKEDIKNDR